MTLADLKSIDITSVAGVGKARAEAFARLGIVSLYDLLFHLPRAYEDWRPYRIADAPVGEVCAVSAVMSGDMTERFVRKGMTIYKCTAFDETGKLWLTFYNNRFVKTSLSQGKEFIFYGKIDGNAYRKAMNAPKFSAVSSAHSVTPRYPCTDGLTSRVIVSTVERVLSKIKHIDDPLPAELIDSLRLCSLDAALRSIHLPTADEDRLAAVNRLTFDELFYMQLGLQMRGKHRRCETDGVCAACNMEPFFSSLPFKLTGCQLAAINDAARDMMSTTPMNRLLQGDVGSGKTVVAAALMYFAKQSGLQSAMMVPTEVLAEQHFETLKKFLCPLGLSVVMLTGSIKPSEKEYILSALSNGNIDVLVGTHALIQDSVVFDRLGLVVTDEQHRFGVDQRAKLTAKGGHAHTLVMSATPIPRTLALMIYGDLDISVLNELPPGRRKIKTYAVGTAARSRVNGFIAKHVAAKRQVYVVCPSIEENEKRESVENVAQVYERMRTTFPDVKTDILHGKLKPREKEAVMRSFIDGMTDILVATTVIEVGIDVANATLMVIENADLFGLSQLHQLRGRVGRSDKQSFCVLMSDASGDDARARINAMCETSDGFEIARTDLQLRGPGDFFGSRQHGLPLLKIADLHSDMDMLILAAEKARELLTSDADLSHHPEIARQVDDMFESLVRV